MGMFSAQRLLIYSTLHVSDNIYLHAWTTPGTTMEIMNQKATKHKITANIKNEITLQWQILKY